MPSKSPQDGFVHRKNMALNAESLTGKKNRSTIRNLTTI